MQAERILWLDKYLTQQLLVVSVAYFDTYAILRIASEIVNTVRTGAVCVQRTAAPATRSV